MHRRFVSYGAVLGFLIVVVPVTLERLVPGMATFFGHLLYWTCPFGLPDMTSAPWWSVMLGGAILNAVLYAVVSLVIGLTTAAVRRLASRHRSEMAKD